MVRMDMTSDSPDRAAVPPGAAVRTADVTDLADVLRVQKAGFRRVAARFGFSDEDMPPLKETLDDLLALREDGVHTFVAVIDEAARERVVGTVRATRRDDGIVEIGRLAVDDGFERRGVATALMRGLEASYPDIARFELYTGSEAVDAISLYSRLGYSIFRREEFPDWTRVWLGKDRVLATAPSGAPLH
jgi:ribosomal protein S18 acetylase RimI-like enzyme